MALRRTAVALCAATATSLALVAPASALVVENPVTDFANADDFQITPIGSYDTGQFDEGAAEIVDFYAAENIVLTVNAQSGSIDVISITDPANPTKVGDVSAGDDVGINSVTVREDGLAVAAVEPADKTAEGEMLFFDANTSEVLGKVKLGNNGEHDAALPDMVGISADGRYAFVANEGEPAEDYSFDPEGSVSIIALPEIGDLRAPAQSDVRVADFRAYNEDGPRELPEGVRIFGPAEVDGAEYSTTVAQNLEPEYITEVGGKLYTTLQENNAVAEVDVETATVTNIFPLGTADHSQVPLDASDRDDRINITEWPVRGIHQPDSIVGYTANDGGDYVVMANEGDARDWDAYSEEARIKHLGDPDETDYADNPLPGICEGFAGMSAEEIEEFQADENAGRLNITIADGLNEDGTCFNELYSFGSRSFSIFSTDGTEVFNSGSEFEEITARLHEQGKLVFNAGHDEGWFDSRSDNKGPEPEGVALGHINGRDYAFIGLERVGGIFVYDITDPANASYVAYVNNRNFDVSAIDEESEELVDNWQDAGDLGAEGLAFIPAADSPNGNDLVVVGNEVSGTTTVFEITGAVTEGSGEDPADGSAAGSSSSSESSVSSSSGLLVVGGLIALIAAIGGVIASTPAIGQLLMSLIPPHLRDHIEDILP